MMTSPKIWRLLVDCKPSSLPGAGMRALPVEQSAASSPGEQLTEGAWHMAVDELLLQCALKGDSPPALRFYTWSSPTLSIGYAQRFRETPLLHACQERALPFVRRPTGGRGVLHHHELTYSIALPPSHDLARSSVLSCYRGISLAIIDGLRSLGIGAEIFPARGRNGNGGYCFSSPSIFEIGFQGRKLVGSAQCRHGGAVLQHGSILLDLDLPLHQDLFCQDASSGSSPLHEVTTMKEALGGIPPPTQIVQQIQKGIEQNFSVSFQSKPLTGEEEEKARGLSMGKYADPSWTFRR